MFRDPQNGGVPCGFPLSPSKERGSLKTWRPFFRGGTAKGHQSGWEPSFPFVSQTKQPKSDVQLRSLRPPPLLFRLCGESKPGGSGSIYAWERLFASSDSSSASRASCGLALHAFWRENRKMFQKVKASSYAIWRVARSRNRTVQKPWFLNSIPQGTCQQSLWSHCPGVTSCDFRIAMSTVHDSLRQVTSLHD